MISMTEASDITTNNIWTGFWSIIRIMYSMTQLSDKSKWLAQIVPQANHMGHVVQRYFSFPLCT